MLRGLDLFRLGHIKERHCLVPGGERIDVRAAAVFGPATLAGPPTVVPRTEWSIKRRAWHAGLMEERKTTGELLDAWRDATRAAELADSLAASASDTSILADSTADAAEQIAKLAEKAAKAAERAALTARDAARRAADLARSSREKNVSGGDHAAAAHAAEEVAKDAYHARVAEASDRHPEDDR